MTRIILLFILTVSLSGCFATKNRCLRLYPPISSVDTVVFETVRDSIVMKGTTIYVKLPGETLIDSILIPQKPGIIHSDTLVLETAFARAEAFYMTPRIHLNLIQKDTTLQIQLENALRESYQWKAKYTEILNKEVVQVKYIPTIYKIALWGWVGCLLLFIMTIVLRLLKVF